LARTPRVVRYFACISCGTLHPCGTIACTGFGHGPADSAPGTIDHNLSVPIPFNSTPSCDSHCRPL
jgi:uncharacterized UBP type Zn finger protein